LKTCTLFQDAQRSDLFFIKLIVIECDTTLLELMAVDQSCGEMAWNCLTKIGSYLES